MVKNYIRILHVFMCACIIFVRISSYTANAPTKSKQVN